MLTRMINIGFPLFASAMYMDLGVGWASSTLAFISIAFIPIPFVLIKVCSTPSQQGSRIARHGFSLTVCLFLKCSMVQCFAGITPDTHARICRQIATRE